MCMNQLRKLAASKLPGTEADPTAIDRLRVLEAAGHIRVLIPPARVDCDDRMRQGAAIVFEIMPRGWKALRAGAPQEEAPLLFLQRAAPAARPKAASVAQELAQIDAWLNGTRRRSGG